MSAANLVFSSNSLIVLDTVARAGAAPAICSKSNGSSWATSLIFCNAIAPPSAEPTMLFITTPMSSILRAAPTAAPIPLKAPVTATKPAANGANLAASPIIEPLVTLAAPPNPFMLLSALFNCPLNLELFNVSVTSIFLAIYFILLMYLSTKRSISSMAPLLMPSGACVLLQPLSNLSAYGYFACI